MPMQTELGSVMPLLPAIAAACAMVFFALHAVPRGRTHGFVVLLSANFLCALAALGLMGVSSAEAVGDSQIILSGCAMLCASIIAAPLLDRGRMPGLVFVAVVGGLATVHAMVVLLPPHLPVISRASVLLVMLFASGVIGLVGSAYVPAHPQRRGYRLAELAPLPVLAGGVFLSIALTGCFMLLADSFAPSSLAMVVSALTSALLCLWRGMRLRHPYALAHAGYGLVAGVLVAALAEPSLGVGVACGIVASICLNCGEAIDPAIALDDPSHHLSILVLPSLIGLLVPTLHDFHLLAQYLRWVSGGLLFAGIAAAVLWPLAKAVFGLEASPRRVREGLDSY